MSQDEELPTYGLHGLASKLPDPSGRGAFRVVRSDRQWIAEKSGREVARWRALASKIESPYFPRSDQNARLIAIDELNPALFKRALHWLSAPFASTGGRPANSN